VAVNGIKKTVHGAGGVIAQMTQIFIDYASMVSPRDITLDEIQFFYRPLIDGLIERQEVKNGKG
jgi:GTP1/Obg family GTP-binding protein